MISMFLLSLLLVMPTASAVERRLRFLAIGDWGGSDEHPYYTEGQWATAQGLASVAAATAEEDLPSASFVLSLGDNFYSSGLPASEEGVDVRFQGTFEGVYSHQELQVPWYILLGNHDYRGNITAQFQYGQSANTRWELPDHNYRVVKKIAADDGGPPVKLEIIMIDTVQLNLGLDEQSSDDNIMLVNYPGKDRAVAALDWISSTLRGSDADYLLVAGHHPIYSPCKHGSTSSLVTHLEPLLKEHGVSAYLSGHEHCQFHFDHEGMNYFTSGTGHSCCYAASNMAELPESGELKYLLADLNDFSGNLGVEGGFLSFDVRKDDMTVTFHKEDGASLYEAVVLSKRSMKFEIAVRAISLMLSKE